MILFAAMGLIALLWIKVAPMFRTIERLFYPVVSLVFLGVAIAISTNDFISQSGFESGVLFYAGLAVAIYVVFAQSPRDETCDRLHTTNAYVDGGQPDPPPAQSGG